jgi:hypothetical protein
VNPILRQFISRHPRVIRLVEDFLFAPGRNTKNETCTVHQEGALRWTRGSAGVASVGEQCLWDGSAYA